MWRGQALALLAAALLASSASAEPDEALNYGCNDLVVVGRVQNLEHIHVDIAGDIIGHGWNLAHVKVQKVLKGSAPGPVVSVRYFAHTFMRDDRDFVLELRPAGGDVYEVHDARLVEGHRLPRLAARCGATSD